MEEEKVTPQPIQPTPPSAPQPVLVHKSNNVPLVGAIIFLALVIAASAVYFGMQKKTTAATTIIPTPTATPSTTSEVPVIPTGTVKTNWLTFESKKFPNLSFPAYTMQYPPTWTKKVELITDIGTVTSFTKEGYEIGIKLGPMGGGGCTFKGDAPQEMSQDFSTNDFVEIKDGDVTFRRVATTSTPSKITYIFCANTPTSKGTYGSPTSFGAITYSTPSAPSTETLSEMDNIVATLKAAN